MQKESVKRHSGGAPSALGRIYDWLQFDNDQDDAGAIKDVVRDFIIEHMPIEAGTVLFGDIVPQRNQHTVATLSNVSGVHRKTLNRALVLTGLFPGGDPEKIESRRTINADDGEALARKIKNSTPIKKIPDYLNCNRTQAQMMVRNGILNKVGNDPSITGGLLSNVANDDLDDFLARFRRAGQPVASAGDGMADVIAASEIARVPVADIVALVLAGRLHRVETGAEELRFKSVFVDPENVRMVSEEEVAGHGLSPKNVSDLIGLKLLAIDLLRVNRDTDGELFLNASTITNARGTVRYCYAKEEVERFRKKYVKLQDLAAERGIVTRTMGLKLSKAGIEPIMEFKSLQAKVFRRKDL